MDVPSRRCSSCPVPASHFFPGKGDSESGCVGRVVRVARFRGAKGREEREELWNAALEIEGMRGSLTFGLSAFPFPGCFR